jgi:hypothetical protein
MKKFVAFIGILALAVSLVQAESQTFTVSVASNQTAFTAALPVHGVIDRVELVRAASAPQCDVIVGTFDGTTVIDTWVSVLNWAEGGAKETKVIRPRLIGTDITGTALTYGSALQVTNITQQLTATYEAPMAGGNVYVKLVNDATGSNITATVKGTIYFTPVQR